MKTTSLLEGRQWMLILFMALLVALAATYAPVVLDATWGTALTPTSFACGHASGGC